MNNINNGIVFTTNIPTKPLKGQVYFNNTSGIFMTYDGNNWNIIQHIENDPIQEHIELLEKDLLKIINNNPFVLDAWTEFKMRLKLQRK